MTEPELALTHRYRRGTADDGVTVLLLHGTGGDETDLLGVGETIAPGRAFLSPRGAVEESGLPRFFRRLAAGVFEQEDLRARTAELADFLLAAAARYDFDPSRIVAAGYSNGANIAASLLLRDPGALAGACLFRPMVPFEPDPSPLTLKPPLDGIPVLLAAGRRDPTVLPNDTERLATLLRSDGADVELHWSPEGHDLDATDLAAARTWLTTHFPL
ncbi:MAG: alpha/beta hydrolase, partial [Gemmatimonadota bacterium]